MDGERTSLKLKELNGGRLNFFAIDLAYMYVSVFFRANASL